VQEKADPRLDAELAQLLAERDQMIVVHPDQIVVAQIRVQLFGKQLIDPPIADVPVAIEAREVEAVMEQRPECSVGEAAVVAIELGLDEIERDVGDVAGADDLGHERPGVGGLTAPAEPDAAGFAQRGQHADRQAAGGRGLAAGNRRNPIRNDDEPAHDLRRRRRRQRPSRLPLSLIMPSMAPVGEPL
jgi:hypothetical protein